MAQYIDKAALVVEIQRLIRKNELYLIDNVSGAVRFQKTGAYSVLNSLLSFIDTLEVKEVDLDTNFGVCWGEYCDCGGNINDYKIAKHFFELGLFEYLLLQYFL